MVKHNGKFCFGKAFFRGKCICIEQFHGRPCMYPTRKCENKQEEVITFGEETNLPE